MILLYSPILGLITYNFCISLILLLCSHLKLFYYKLGVVFLYVKHLSLQGNIWWLKNNKSHDFEIHFWHPLPHPRCDTLHLVMHILSSSLATPMLWPRLCPISGKHTKTNIIYTLPWHFILCPCTVKHTKWTLTC